MADKTFNLKVVNSTQVPKGILDGSLVRFKIPDGVTSLGRERFYNFNNLTYLDFNQVEEIPENTCRGCTNLATVIFTNHTTSIGAYAFYDCTKFEDIELPHTLTNIDFYAFYNAGSAYSQGTHTFTMINNEGVHTTIGAGAFQFSHLSNIDAYLNDVGPEAFSNCSSLTDVNVEIHGSLGPYAFDECRNVTNFSISPDTVITELSHSVFRYLAYNTYASANIADFDFRKSSFTTLDANTWGYCRFNGKIYFPSTLSSIKGNFLNSSTGNWMLYFTSAPTVNSSSYLRSDDGTSFTVKYCFPYDILGVVSNMTNWSTHTSQMMGYGTGFEAGSTLPQSLSSSGLIITWYTDDTLTTKVTVSTGADMVYYCTLISFLPTLADNDWSMIKLASQIGAVPDTWKVGDTKTYNYNGRTYTARLLDKTGSIGLTRASDSKPAYLYFETTEQLDNDHAAFSSGSNNVKKSSLIKDLNSGKRWGYFENDLRSALEDVNVVVAEQGKTAYSAPIPLKVWLPRFRDLFTVSNNWCRSDEWDAIGNTTTYYQGHDNNNDRRKAYNGTLGSQKYWCLSPSRNMASNLCIVNSDGSGNYVDARNSLGVVPCFAL